MSEMKSSEFPNLAWFSHSTLQLMILNVDYLLLSEFRSIPAHST